MGLAETVANFSIWYVVFLFSVTFHEFSHSLIAYLGGDPTAYEGGTMSLDPVPHIKRSPWGTVIWPVVSFFMAGWMVGWASAPIDPGWAQRYPRRAALMAAAGPFSNFLLVVVAFVLMKALVASGTLVFSPYMMSDIEMVVAAPGMAGHGSMLGALAKALSIMLSLNIILCVFNLLPAPPLDGAFVLEGLFPQTVGNLLYRMRVNPGMSLLVFIIAYQIAPYVIWPARAMVLRLLVGA